MPHEQGYTQATNLQVIKLKNCWLTIIDTAEYIDVYIILRSFAHTHEERKR